MYDTVLHFAQDKLTAVISWLSPEGSPQSATTFYWLGDITDTDFNIYFGTRHNTRKFAGIKKDPRVAMVIGTEFEPRSLQIEGRATAVSIDDGLGDFKRSLQKFRAPVTQAMLYENSFFQGDSRSTNFVIFKLTPNWVRFMDYNRVSSDVIYHQIIDHRDAPPAARQTPATKAAAKRRKRN